MPANICRVAYFYALIKNQPGEAYALLSRLAAADVNLLAFSTVPMGPQQTQLVLFPETRERLVEAADNTGTVLTGPQHAFLVRGDDELGALVQIHMKLADAGINVWASNGVTDGRGGYGYILYVGPDEFESAAHVLEV